ncbi:DUF1499 domain-containing protein [Novipirellula sp. SH528]|uniref:DUF1499 domain-containing protein n=1 Tax=Novipirellula sp. SH528 TaxID=3454466 RepID=UPI003F9F64DD
MSGFLAVAITIVLLVIVAALLRIDNWSRDFTENSASTEERFPDSVGVIDSKLQRWVAETSRWKVESKTESAGTIEYKITRTTPLFRFVDDIDVKLSSDEAGIGTQLHAKSQSRVGKGDLGQNPRNLKALVEGIRKSAD